MEEQERGPDDLIFPRKKTLTDLWREEWEREFKRNNEKFINNKKPQQLF
jgi:hypothetical protein